MEGKNEYLFKFYKRPQIMIFSHIIIALAGLVFFASIFNTKGFIFLYLWVSTIVMHLSLCFFSAYFGWNAIIYFGSDKIWQNKKRKYEWRWEDITDCKLHVYPARAPYIIISITTNPNYKKLKLEYDRRREKILLEKCPNERVKELLKKVFEE